MTLLALGLIVFFGIHLIPGIQPSIKTKLIGRIGLLPYKGIYAFLSLAGFMMITRGWQAINPVTLYLLPDGLMVLISVLVFTAIMLFIISVYPSNIKRWVRHPQLTAVVLFSGAHLLANGDTRSVVLFGGFLIWAIMEIFLINHRDGSWVKSTPKGWSKDIAALAITAVVFYSLVQMHSTISGVALG